mmetsp:Transcript_95813/g.254448  ORF Transcript_95813/g.254448 Transcript_95813/m.254448 type:complete len:208 (-) Transcript_95813:977-1600(-)
MRCSARRFSSMSIWAFLSSDSCCIAFSMTCVPTSILSSMAFSFWTICSCAFSSSSLRDLRSCSSSRSFCLSSSASLWSSSILRFSSAIACSICKRSSSRFAWIAAMSSSVTPVLTIFSTVFSTSMTFSTSTTSFSTMTCCSCGSWGAAGCFGCLTLAGLGVVAAAEGAAARFASCMRRRVISSWNSRIMASLGSSLILGLFLMLFAR